MATKQWLGRALIGAALMAAAVLLSGHLLPGGGAAAAGAWTPGATAQPEAGALDAAEIRETITRVADWQLRNPLAYGPLHWVIAALYEGLIEASLATGDPKYMAAVIFAGREVGWGGGRDVYHADAHAVAHAWLRLYQMDPDDPSMLEPFRERFDRILGAPVDERLSFTAVPRTPGVEMTDRWTWSDALYMSPPALALLTTLTGDERYMEFADEEYKAAYDALFDPAENLFYRDSRFIHLRTPSGEKVFWSRGNAWVYAGLALMLDGLPEDYPARGLYVDLFRRMSTAVLQTQQPDGLWYPSLLDPGHVPIGETSGSALFVYGLAWGIRNGLIDEATYRPAVERGWRGLVTRIEPDGAVRYVQPIGAQPEMFDLRTSEAYGTGAVLMAGSEILRAMGAVPDLNQRALVRRAEAMAATAADLSIPGGEGSPPPLRSGATDRAYLVGVLTRIADPVLTALSKGELKERMPIQEWESQRTAWTHYEAFARTLAGIAPWLELGPDDTEEGRLRARYIELARRSLINATDPASPDYMNFGQIPDQPLVESAYLASALLSAPTQLWGPLTDEQRENVLDALRISRGIEVIHNNNWVLFPAMVEAAMWRYGDDPRIDRIEHAVHTLQDWYLGDGMYGDGPNFHWDYYNSFVIHPMLIQVLSVAEEMGHPIARFMPVTLDRAGRYAEVLERVISPEGTFPVMGRSSAYRFAAFYNLGYMALRGDLPRDLEPAAVRGGITAVVRRMVEAPGTFDEEGWLRLGAVGYQPGIRETYNSTGALYICLTGLVHLGLPPDDPLWTDRAAPWTQQQIWRGRDIERDHALRQGN